MSARQEFPAAVARRVRALLARPRDRWITAAVVACCIAAAVTAVVVTADSADHARPVAAGGAFAWGENTAGGLGTGSSARATAPTPVLLPRHTVSVAAGGGYTLALTSDGRVYGWGRNSHGQLGDGTTVHRLHPVQAGLPRGARITAISAGNDHSVALSSTGQVYAWGANQQGELGDGGHVERHTPARVNGTGRVSAVSAGRDYTLALTSTGRVVAWGANGRGQLGDGTTTSHPTPVKVRLPAADGVRALAAGDGSSVAVTGAGTVLQWGDNVSTGADTRAPAEVTGDRLGHSPAEAIDAGDGFVVALTSDGRLHTWGTNEHGQLGDGTTEPAVTPVTVALPGKAKVREVSVAGESVFALTRDGDLYGWGANQFGQLGNGTVSDKPNPTRISALAGSRILGIAGGRSATFVLVAHGPAAALRLAPTTATVGPGNRHEFAVHRVDAFGNDLGPASGHVTLRVTGGTCQHTACRAGTAGEHVVTAADTHPGTPLIGAARLIVRTPETGKGHS